MSGGGGHTSGMDRTKTSGADPGELAAEEQSLGEVHVGVGLSDTELALELAASSKVTLDQLWDVVRQRRAKRHAGQDPDVAAQRPADTVEGYLQ